jgi:hypothetical protein
MDTEPDRVAEVADSLKRAIRTSAAPLGERAKLVVTPQPRLAPSGTANLADGRKQGRSGSANCQQPPVPNADRGKHSRDS